MHYLPCVQESPVKIREEEEVKNGTKMCVHFREVVDRAEHILAHEGIL